ncbi:MAG: hypothetical protein ACXW4H_07960 [Candidatus Limnocylindrales bacterium]
MSQTCRETRIVLGLILVLAFAACSSTPSATTTSPDATPPSSPAASASPSAPPSHPLTSPSALVPASPAVSAVACPVTLQTGLLPSDRLVDLAISSTPTHDLLTFVFAASSPGPGGPARGTLEAASPPFSFAGSGQEFPLLGQHAVQLRFSGMTIASESGEATYHGPTDAKPDLPALREAIQYDASEGIVGWYVGFDGPGCVTLVREGNDVTVMIAHPEAPAG